MTFISEKFEEKFIPVPESGCWLWMGTGTRRGYGEFRKDGVMRFAHRASYEEAYGPIPEGMMVCHRCDVPACVNPDHLWIGTQKDNLEDMTRKGRRVALRGSKSPRAKLTDAQVDEIRASQDTYRVIGRRFGISTSQVSKIRNGQQWKRANGEAAA